MRGSNREHKGEHNCSDVECSSWNNNHQACIFCIEDIPCLLIANLPLAEQELQKWIDKHPVMTNREKAKEVFGIEIRKTFSDCIGLDCPQNGCDNCEYKDYWSQEYKGL